MNTVSPKSARADNPVVLYDRETAEPLRRATREEIDEHYQCDTRDAPPLEGETLGFPGRKLWLAHLDPREIILGWAPDGHPIFKGWKYRGWEHREATSTVNCRQVMFTATDALRFARDVIHTRDGRVDGSRYKAVGARIVVDYKQDLGLPPAPILAAWRATYWLPGGEINHAAKPPNLETKSV